ncbi:MAG: transporter [Deltaproteobacteria bacterium]|nr:transporter [Deltaproteobacteria bacterium]
MKKTNTLVVGSLLVLLWVTAGFGVEMPDHGKLNTEEASPVDPGSMELFFGYGYTRVKNYWDNDRTSRSRGLWEEHAAGMAVKIGIVRDLDLGLVLAYLGRKDRDHLTSQGEQGFSDLSLDLRYRFLNLKQYQLEVAYVVGLTIPTKSSLDPISLESGQEFWSWNNALVVTKDWGAWTMNAEAGYSLPFGEHRGPARGIFSTNLALGYQILSWLQPETELNYVRDIRAGGRPGENLAVTAGLVMPINDLLRVNLGVQQGLWGRNSDQAATFLLTVKLAF